MRSNWWADALGPLLVGAAEGAWVLVLYELIETVGRGPTPLGLPVFVVVAFLGALAGSRLERQGEPRWRGIAAAAVGLGAVGMLTAPGVFAGLVAGDPGAALAAHPGGWLLGIAAFRGLLGGGVRADADEAGKPFARSVIVLTLAWLYAGLLPASSQVAFRAATLGPTVLFSVAGVAAASLHRVQAVAVPAGIAWWRNRVWLVTVTGALLLLALMAVPVADALVTGVPAILGLDGFAEVVAMALVIAWLVVPRTGPHRPRGSLVRGLVGVAILAAIGAIFFELLHPKFQPPAAAAQAGGAAQAADSGSPVGVVILVAIVAVISLLALVAARKWRRGPRHGLIGEVADEVAFDVEGPGLGWLRRPWARLRRRPAGGRPATAEAAYLATLGLLESVRAWRRLPEETPAAHAARLHREGSGSLELDLLAADYELSRWGARRLPLRETRRAIGRWDRARQRVTDAVAAERAAQAFADAGDRSSRPGRG